MSRGDGTNPKFRLLCKKCNSYLHTGVKVLPRGGCFWWTSPDKRVDLSFYCLKCNNVAHGLFEEFDREPADVPTPEFRR